VIKPLLAAGQIEGGIAQGIGFALYENVVLEQGAMKNNQFTNYIIPPLRIRRTFTWTSSSFLIPIPGHTRRRASVRCRSMARLPPIGSAVAHALGEPIHQRTSMLPERIMHVVNRHDARSFTVNGKDHEVVAQP